MTQDNKSWEEEFLKIHYEPEHESGPTCWCGPTYFKEDDGLTHLRHKEQRDVIKSFIHSTLNKERNRLIERVEGMRIDRTNKIYRHEADEQMEVDIGYNQALSDILTILKEK